MSLVRNPSIQTKLSSPQVGFAIAIQYFIGLPYYAGVLLSLVTTVRLFDKLGCAVLH